MGGPLLRSATYMRHAAQRCNSEMSEGVFHKTQIAHAVDQNQVEPHRCQLSFRRVAQIFRRRRENPLHLPLTDPLQRPFKTDRFLHLAKHIRLGLTQDQVDLAARPAPAPLQQLRAARLISPQRRILRRTARQIGPQTAIPARRDLSDRGLEIETHLAHSPPPFIGLIPCLLHAPPPAPAPADRPYALAGAAAPPPDRWHPAPIPPATPRATPCLNRFR